MRRCCLRFTLAGAGRTAGDERTASMVLKGLVYRVQRGSWSALWSGDVAEGSTPSPPGPRFTTTLPQTSFFSDSHNLQAQAAAR